MTPFADLLEGLTRVPGVRSAQVVSAEDGLPVAEASQAGVDGAAIAALGSSLAARLDGMITATGGGGLRSLHLETGTGGLMVMPVTPELLLVAVVDADANIGLLRLSMRHAAERLD